MREGITVILLYTDEAVGASQLLLLQAENRQHTDRGLLFGESLLAVSAAAMTTLTQ